MFEELKEGKTHSYNDNCGEPAHNPTTRHLIKLAKEVFDEPVEDWKKQVREIIDGIDDYKHNGADQVIEIVDNLLQKQQLPEGISQWKNRGEKYGYDKYFEEKIREKVILEIQKVIIQRMKEIANTRLSERKNSFDELCDLSKKLNILI